MHIFEVRKLVEIGLITTPVIMKYFDSLEKAEKYLSRFGCLTKTFEYTLKKRLIKKDIEYTTYKRLCKIFY